MILQASNAVILNNFEEATPIKAALFSPKNMVFDSNNQLFLALSYNSRFTVIGMTTTSTSAFTSIFTYQSAGISSIRIERRRSREMGSIKSPLTSKMESIAMRHVKVVRDKD